MNSRPLTIVSPDIEDLDVLTPNRLLVMRQGPSVSCGMFEKANNYSRRCWRHVQYLADTFWTRWVRENLPEMDSERS